MNNDLTFSAASFELAMWAAFGVGKRHALGESEEETTG